jgi:hypothetical protein
VYAGASTTIAVDAGEVLVDGNTSPGPDGPATVANTEIIEIWGTATDDMVPLDIEEPFALRASDENDGTPEIAMALAGHGGGDTLAIRGGQEAENSVGQKRLAVAEHGPTKGAAR